MLWIKALHIVFMVTWFAGIFYLPRLFVYHSQATDAVSIARFKVMQHKLFWIIMTPGACLTVLFGLIMLHGYAWTAYKHTGWLHAKLFLVGCLVVYHVYLGSLLRTFRRDENRRGHRFFRMLNEVPNIFLFGIVILVVVKPF